MGLVVTVDLNAVFGTELMLDKDLKRKTLFVKEKDGSYLEYVEHYFAEMLGTTRYLCQTCKLIGGEGSGVKVVVKSDGGFVGSQYPVHKCTPKRWNLEDIVAREIDRKARKRVAEKVQAPRQSCEQGFEE